MSKQLISAYRVCSSFIEGYTPFKLINRIFFFRCLMNDRWGWLNQFSDINFYNLNERPKSIPSKPVVFADEIDRRANEILNLAYNNDKQIIVSYSGGVDSSCVVSSLIKNNTRNQKLAILFTDESINENPEMFDFIKRNNITLYHKNSDDLYDDLNIHNDYIFTNGWCADQLFHFGIINFLPDDAFHVNWKDGIVYMLEVLHKSSKDELIPYSDAIDILDDYMSHVLDHPITELCEFAWFWNFVCKYSYIRNVVNLESRSEYLLNHNIPFFDTCAFNIFALQNYHTIKERGIWIRDPSSYKMELKRYTADITGNANGLKQTKLPSYIHRYKYTQSQLKFSVIDDQGLTVVDNMENQYSKYAYLMTHYKKFG